MVEKNPKMTKEQLDNLTHRVAKLSHDWCNEVSVLLFYQTGIDNDFLKATVAHLQNTADHLRKMQDDYPQEVKREGVDYQDYWD